MTKFQLQVLFLPDFAADGLVLASEWNCLNKTFAKEVPNLTKYCSARRASPQSRRYQWIT